jgi:DNA adenine methylase
LLAALPVRIERYYEPFAGSACLFFALRPERAVLSDFNGQLIAAYRMVREHPRLVYRAASAWGADANSYYRVRALELSELPPVLSAARFVYLNRYCFNGVYRTNRKNQFNVPYGNRGGRLPDERRFYRASVALRRAELLDTDFEDALESVRRGDLVYLDPPYSRGHGDEYGMYGYGSFTGSDLIRMLAALHEVDRRGARFVFSYTPTPEVLAATADWHQASVTVRAQVGGRVSRRSVRDELLVTNYPLGAE